MNFVAVPGFGDTTKYWAECLEDIGTVTSVEWPGVWDDRVVARPLGYVVEEVSRAADGSVLIAHSAGCRAVLSGAQQTMPLGIILLAPALGSLSFLDEEAVAVWRRAGYRSTYRPDPVTDEIVELQIPVSYAEDLLDWQMPGGPSCPVLVVLLSSDEDQNGVSRALLSGDRTQISTISGPHRWWERADVCEQVDAAIIGWLREIA
jgi:hypothetical protein